MVVVNEWVRASGSGRREGVSSGSRKVNTTRMEYKILWREQVSESQRRRLRLSMEHKTATSGVEGASTGDTRSRSRAAAGGGLRLVCHWPAPHPSLFGPMLHLAQDSSPLACSSHHAPQSPWGKLRFHLTKTLSPLWPPLLRHIDKSPTANLTSREASRTTCGCGTGGCNKSVSSCSSACYATLPVRGMHAKLPKGRSALPASSHITSRAEGPVTWEASGTSAASALKPQPSRNETRVMRIIGLPDQAGAFVMSALTSPCWVQIDGRWRVPMHPTPLGSRTLLQRVCEPKTGSRRFMHRQPVSIDVIAYSPSCRE